MNSNILLLVGIFMILATHTFHVKNDKNEILEAIDNKECKIAPIDSSKLEDIILPVKKK